MTRGDLVHIPQGALLLKNKSAPISDAEFINLKNVTQISKTMNKKFLEKN